jgi:hypothetical protein
MLFSFGWLAVRAGLRYNPTQDARQGRTAFVNCDQFYEYAHWGPSDGTPETDPNPRLEAYLAAARRGATVRILLDRYFDLEGENAATVAYLQGVARAEGLDMQARLGDPTQLGLHNKMVLASIGGRGYVHTGSLNGGKSSAKINRELALQVQSNEAYDYLKAVFDYDWRLSTPAVYLPLVIKDFEFLQPADHLLICHCWLSDGCAFSASTRVSDRPEVSNHGLPCYRHRRFGAEHQQMGPAAVKAGMRASGNRTPDKEGSKEGLWKSVLILPAPDTGWHCPGHSASSW